MSIITFVNNIEEETGKSMSLAAIATYMSIEHNVKILVVSTTNKDDKLNSCFFEDGKQKKFMFGLFGENKEVFENESGIEGISKIARSNKLTPEIITNYTKVVFKNRLEVLPGGKRKNVSDFEENEIEEEYINIISLANKYYDLVFVDLDNNINYEVKDRIINMSDLIIMNISQNYKKLKKFKENKTNNDLLKLPKTLLLIGRYDKYSKYNYKNITRFLGEKNMVLTIPYNTLYFEAANEAGVPDLFLKLKRLSNSDDRNAIFIQEIKRASENIIYRLQELQSNM